MFSKSSGQFSVHNNLLKLSAAYDIPDYSLLLEILSSFHFWNTSLSWLSSSLIDHSFSVSFAECSSSSQFQTLFLNLKRPLFSTYIYFPGDLINSRSFKSSVHWWLPNIYLQSRLLFWTPDTSNSLLNIFTWIPNRHLKYNIPQTELLIYFPKPASSLLHLRKWHLHFSSCSCKNPRHLWLLCFCHVLCWTINNKSYCSLCLYPDLNHFHYLSVYQQIPNWSPTSALAPPTHGIFPTQ